MFKSIVLATLITLATSASFAKQETPTQQELNFQICASQDESWMRRFGQYVISFELAEAYNFCYKKAWPNRKVKATRVGCSYDGSWHTAGYYCESF